MKSRKTISKDEWVNTLTHAIGLCLGAFGMAVLLWEAFKLNDSWRLVSFIIYGLSLVTMYAASTFYHFFIDEKWKFRMKIVDHAAIYALIAGTYTPFMLVMLRDHGGWPIFILVWLLALAGIIFKIFFIQKFKLASTMIYLLMGWMVVAAARPMIRYIPEGGLMLLIAGGLSYSFGVVFYLWKRIPYHHGIWHLFVLGGSICHYLAIYFYVLPLR